MARTGPMVRDESRRVRGARTEASACIRAQFVARFPVRPSQRVEADGATSAAPPGGERNRGSPPNGAGKAKDSPADVRTIAQGA